MTGYAKLNSTTQQFLNSCPAVTAWRDLPKVASGNEYVSFDFDESVDVYAVPNGVYFDKDSIDDDVLSDIVEWVESDAFEPCPCGRGRADHNSEIGWLCQSCFEGLSVT